MTGAIAVPAPAATVVLLRPGPDGAEVLLIHRPATMAFGPGLHVFPGGRVDPEDGDDRSDATAGEAAQALGGNLPPAEALAVHRAAIRELREEAGVALASIDELAPIAHWTTPAFMPRRFSTWFFVADLPTDAAPVFEADEVAAHRWVTPATALDQMATGEIDMWVPTTSVLERLLEIGATSSGDVARRITLRPIAPPRILAETPTDVRLVFGAVGGLPGRRGEARVIGQRRVVVVDPGDQSDEALGLLNAVIARRAGLIAGIVLSRTDPDHAAAAEAIAIPLDVPILVAPGAGRHLPYATREAVDGERLPADIEASVRLGTPGSGRLDVVSG